MLAESMIWWSIWEDTKGIIQWLQDWMIDSGDAHVSVAAAESIVPSCNTQQRFSSY